MYLLKIVSISAITSGDKGLSVVKKASMFSFSCSTDVAPMIVLVMNGRSLTNPSASSTGLSPCFLATSMYCVVASWHMRHAVIQKQATIYKTTLNKEKKIIKSFTEECCYFHYTPEKKALFQLGLTC